MVKINEYNELSIEYEDGLFFCMVGDSKLEADTESKLKEIIDKQSTIIKEKELKELMKIPDFKIVLADTKPFYESIKMLNGLSSEAWLVFDKVGMNITLMDPANVALVSFTLHSSMCVEWHTPKKFMLGVNLSNLKNILSKAKLSDILVLSKGLDSHKKDCLNIGILGDITTNYTLQVLEELYGKVARVPELKYKSSITLPVSYIANALTNTEIVSDSVNFFFENNNFIVSGKADFIDSGKIVIKPNELVTIESTDYASKSKYSVDYLKKIFISSRNRAWKICSNVKVSFNKDYPLKVEYKILDKIDLLVILAPRIEND